MAEEVILVNEDDKILGYMDKLKAHKSGDLHRAISVFIFNYDNEMLIQRRALSKYHTAGLWSNTACSHPRKNELTLEAANRRLIEEMGISTDLFFAFKFKYKSILNNNLIENELDHVFYGFSDKKPDINLSEVCEYKYICKEELDKLILDNPDLYTPWFKLIYERVFRIIKKQYT
tara:strand:+ start:568 stop:1092 length:525 start_codon:yes stop_codon:yes gene_type:complete